MAMSKFEPKSSGTSRTVFNDQLQPTQINSGLRTSNPEEQQSSDDLSSRNLTELKKFFEKVNNQPVEKLCRSQHSRPNHLNTTTTIIGNAVTPANVSDSKNVVTHKRPNNLKIANGCSKVNHSNSIHKNLGHQPNDFEKNKNDDRHELGSISDRPTETKKPQQSFNTYNNAKPVIIRPKPKHLANGSASSVCRNRNGGVPVMNKEKWLPGGNSKLEDSASINNSQQKIIDKLTSNLSIGLPGRYRRHTRKPAISAKPKHLMGNESRMLRQSTSASEQSSDISSESAAGVDTGSQPSIYEDLGDSFSSFEDTDFDSEEEIYGNHSEQDSCVFNTPRILPDQTENSLAHTSFCNSPKLQRPEKLQRVIDEFKSTERIYVQKLQLIYEEFCQALLSRNQQESIVSEDTARLVSSNISCLYKLHCKMLREIECCNIPYSSSDMRIGLVFKNYGPFFSMYSLYYCNLYEANKAFELARQKSPKFAKFIADIEAKPECCNLPFQFHLVEPVQRIPRYQLLLKEYLKNLPEDSIDREDAEKAHELVIKASKNSCDVMKRMDSDLKLLKISRSLSCGDELLSPTRQLIKEGAMVTLSKRRGCQKQRYFYLFNDFLLICRSGADLYLKPYNQISQKIAINRLKISTGRSSSNTFYLMGEEEVIEVRPSSAEEAEAWLEALNTAIKDCTTSSKSVCPQLIPYPLGSAAPLWIKDFQADFCMICFKKFSSLTRRHHCRACGHVICSECSPNRMKLSYTGQVGVRVCVDCYTKLHEEGRLVMDSGDDFIVSGFLQISRDMKAWNQHWFALQRRALFSFTSKMVKVTTSAIPLDGYRIGEISTDDEEIFLLTKSMQSIYYFKTDNKEEFSKWTVALKGLMQSEISNNLLQKSPSLVTEINQQLNKDVGRRPTV